MSRNEDYTQASNDQPAAPTKSERVRLSKGGSAFGFPVASLRTEARKGNLILLRIAGKDYVTSDAIKDMVAKCTIVFGEK